MNGTLHIPTAGKNGSAIVIYNEIFNAVAVFTVLAIHSCLEKLKFVQGMFIV